MYPPALQFKCNSKLPPPSSSSPPQELESLQGSLSTRGEELKAVKRENRKRRKVIEAYQEMMSAGATGLHTVS